MSYFNASLIALLLLVMSHRSHPSVLVEVEHISQRVLLCILLLCVEVYCLVSLLRRRVVMYVCFRCEVWRLLTSRILVVTRITYLPVVCYVQSEIIVVFGAHFKKSNTSARVLLGDEIRCHHILHTTARYVACLWSVVPESLRRICCSLRLSCTND